MPSQAHLADLYIILLLVATMVTVLLVVFAWQRRVIPGALSLSLMNFLVMLWLILTILDWTSLNLGLKLFWNQLGYICVGFLPISWVAFSLNLTQKNWFRPIYTLIIGVIPSFMLYLAFKNELWTSIHYTFLDGSSFGLGYYYQEVKFSGWIYISIGFAYLLIIGGALNIIFSLIRHPDHYRRKAISPLIGSLAPLTLNIFYNFHIIPNWTMDLTPLGFAISSVALTWALFRDRLFNLTPLAHGLLIDTMSDGLIVLDTNLVILDLNPAAQTITQKLQKIAVGKPLFNVLPAITTFPFNGEISIIINQETRFYDVKSSPLFNKTNSIIEGHMIMLRDISARKEAEIKLSRSEEIFRSLIEQSYDGVLLTDHEGIITNWNQSMVNITGLSQESILNHYMWELVDLLKIESKVPKVTSDIARKYFLSLLSNRSIFIFDKPIELPILVDNHEQRFVQNVTFPINTSSGIILGSITRDVTLGKKNENEIKELYEGSLILQKEAEAASESKSQFLAVMSHELRTPMNAVIGMIQLLMDTNLSSKQLDYAETIRSSGDTLLALINDILDYSKIESEKMDLEDRPFNLRTVIEESFDLVSQRADEKRLELLYIVSPSVPHTLVGDPTRVRQIITNLIGNAVKFTERGEITLMARAIPLISENKYEKYQLFITVNDTGIGIPEEKISRLFKTFSQIDQTTTRVYGGTGLGLAICKRLVEAMGGNLGVRSIPGKGSSFYFSIQAGTIPVVLDDFEDRVSKLAKGKSVLIFDENLSFQKIASKIFIQLGMKTKSVSSPDSCLEILKNPSENLFDLILVNCAPFSSEKETWLNNLKLYTQQSHLVLLTSQWNPLRDKSILKLADAVTHKPIKYNRLLNLIFQMLSGNPVDIPSDKSAESIKLPVLGPQHPLRILMVEDNLVNQKVIINSLERLGYYSKIANNGFSCLELMKDNTFDVILMDVQMAEMDGLETTRRIRKQWPLEQQPRIIALTAAAMTDDQAKCFEAGMDDYISKPIRLPELVQSLLDSRPISTFDPAPYIITPIEVEKKKIMITPNSEMPLIQRKSIEDLLRTLGKNKSALVRETIDIFISESGEYVNNLKKAMVEKNLEKMRRLTHTLKATTASVGAIHLSNSCKALDIEIRTLLSMANPSLAPGQFENEVLEIVNEFSLVCAELEVVKSELIDMAEKIS